MNTLQVARDLRLLILFGSLCAVLYGGHYFLFQKEYLVLIDVPCAATEKETCFVDIGDSSAPPYKKVYIRANAIPQCRAWAGQCPAPDCPVGADYCHIEYCSSSSGDDCAEE